MEEIWLPGHVDRETEFVGGLHAACGPNAAAMAERWADQSRLGTLDVYHRMRAAGHCDADGAATLPSLATDARAAGYCVDTLAFHQPMPTAQWRAFFEKYVGHEAIVFEAANGQALVDALSGKGENARNLHCHFGLGRPLASLYARGCGFFRGLHTPGVRLCSSLSAHVGVNIGVRGHPFRRRCRGQNWRQVMSIGTSQRVPGHDLGPRVQAMRANLACVAASTPPLIT